MLRSVGDPDTPLADASFGSVFSLSYGEGLEMSRLIPPMIRLNGAVNRLFCAWDSWTIAGVDTNISRHSHTLFPYPTFWLAADLVLTLAWT